MADSNFRSSKCTPSCRVSTNPRAGHFSDLVFVSPDTATHLPLLAWKRTPPCFENGACTRPAVGQSYGGKPLQCWHDSSEITSEIPWRLTSSWCSLLLISSFSVKQDWCAVLLQSGHVIQCSPDRGVTPHSQHIASCRPLAFCASTRNLKGTAQRSTDITCQGPRTCFGVGSPSHPMQSFRNGTTINSCKRSLVVEGGCLIINGFTPKCSCRRTCGGGLLCAISVHFLQAPTVLARHGPHSSWNLLWFPSRSATTATGLQQSL